MKNAASEQRMQMGFQVRRYVLRIKRWPLVEICYQLVGFFLLIFLLNIYEFYGSVI